jgi:iron complex outermembrane recepter protein
MTVVDTKKLKAMPPNLVRFAVAAIIAGIPLTFSQGAHAQEAADAGLDELDEVTVTGSRIQRRDLESNSPLVTVDNAALEQRSGLNIESYLNQLPAFNPAAAPTILNGPGSNSDVQISAISSVGISAVSLRGFGSNRTLTLIEGRRTVPNNALMTVNINDIPSSMIKRLEIISGGASATYGADAIGGVANFLLRKDFEGLETDLQYGKAEVGDNQEIRASAIAGTKISDGRGNIVFAAEYYDREAAFQKNRDFFTDGWADPSVPGNFLGFVFGANGINSFNFSGAPATLATILGKQPNQVYASPGFGANASLRFNPDGTIFDPAGNNAASWGRPIDGQQFAYVNVYDNSQNIGQTPTGDPIQQVKYNEIEGYASSPQTRFSFMASTKFEVTDNIRFFSDARFAQSKTTTFLAGTNASLGWEATIPYNATVDSPVNPTLNYRDQAVVAAVLANPAAYANPNFIAHGAAGAQHPVPLEMAILLNSRGPTPNSPQGRDPLTTGWILETFPLDSFGRRATIDENNAWQIETGFGFDIPVKDWTGEVYYSRGESSTYNVAQGNNSLARWRGMVTAADYGRNASLQSNSGGANPNFGSVPVKCTSGFYETVFHGDAKPTDDCLYAVQAQLQTRTENQQDIVELNFQGGLFDMPAGELRGAAGYQYRRNSAQFNPDILQSTASFTDQVIGVYPTGYLDAETTVRDVYAELLVPVIGGFRFLKTFELELGGRKSDYKDTKDTTTFKINGNIAINDTLRFRGGFNRATRAPNLGELYLNLQQVFGAGGVYGDPCGPLSNSPFGAGGAIANPYPSGGTSRLAGGQTAAGAQSAYLICLAQMGAGANTFYSAGNPLPPAATGGGFAWNNQQGNPNLESETADTWTAGFVLQSPWESPWLSGLSTTVDWYSIKIEDVIEPYSVDYARFLCYGTNTVSDAAGAAAQAASPACQAVPRSTATGGALTQLLQFSNQATVDTSGVDFGINWAAGLGELGLESVPGRVGLNVQGTWLDYYKTKLSPANYDPTIDWKGSLGPNVPGFNSGAYSYRLFTSLNYALPTMNVSLRWRFLPSVDQINKAQENAIIENNAKVAAGGEGIILSYTPTTVYKTESYSTFDLAFNWNLSDKYSVRAGVDNLFDKDPAITTNTSNPPAYTAGYPRGTTLGAVCGSAPGCQNPTTYTLPNSGQGTTSGGYYDTLGRRYYLGFKAQF